MWRSSTMCYIVSRLKRAGMVRPQTHNSFCSITAQPQMSMTNTTKVVSMLQDHCDCKAACQNLEQDAESSPKYQIGKNVSRDHKINFLVNTLLDLKDNKEAVYGSLDAWVAWEQNFPIALLKRALLSLEKEHQWHRIVQVIKWMLSKGQGNTMGTYGQLIRALDMDHRAEEAHMFWIKKIGTDLHSVPWQLCKLMMSVYHRNNMLESLVQLFKGLETFDRKPPEKSIVQKVADAYEMLGMVEEKERVLQKYNDTFSEEGGIKKKSKNASSRKGNRRAHLKHH